MAKMSVPSIAVAASHLTQCFVITLSCLLCFNSEIKVCRCLSRKPTQWKVYTV